MLTSPHKEKMTCDDCHQTFCKGDIIAHYRSNAVRYCHMNCDLRSHGTPACRPKKEKREDAGEEGGDFQKEWDEIMHGTNPCTIYGTRRLEWENVLEIGVFSGKFNALFSLLEKYADALSRTRKEATEKAWRKAREIIKNERLEAPVPDSEGDETYEQALDDIDRQLINAAKEDGVEIEV